MIIIDELPFRFVENEGFRRCMRANQPALFIPSRITIKRDCYQFYLDEKSKLKTELKRSTLRVCFTTDTWTSGQRINYMCLTAHYVDESWKLQKKVINFCQILSHKGKDIGRAVETCLRDWELEDKVMTVTVDNASSNDTASDYLKSKLVKQGDHSILEGKWMHVRCVAHIMNLIVQEGLKDLGGSIDRIRAAVRWVRLSPARLKRFKDFSIFEKIECGKSLCLDVPTRWNSSYLMLSVAIEYEKAFDRLSEEDSVYVRDLQVKVKTGADKEKTGAAKEKTGADIENGEADKEKGGPGVPVSTDWDNARRLVIFLRHFYDLTLRVSGTKYITSNTYLDSISCIDSVLKKCASSQDLDLKEMAISMMSKFGKYWGDIKKFNFLVFIASVFDPRTKLTYLWVTLLGMYGSEGGDLVYDSCKKALDALFEDYKRIYSKQHEKNVSSSSHSTSESTSITTNDTLFSNSDDTLKAIRERNMAEVKRQKAERGVKYDTKSELDRYTEEEIEGDELYFDSSEFTVLG